jgi:hypothetical protein
MSSFNGKAPYAPDYASYNWIGAPSNYELTTNADLGGDSRTFGLLSPPNLYSLRGKHSQFWPSRHLNQLSNNSSCPSFLQALKI